MSRRTRAAPGRRREDGERRRVSAGRIWLDPVNLAWAASPLPGPRAAWRTARAARSTPRTCRRAAAVGACRAEIRKSRGASLPRRLWSVCSRTPGSPPKVRLRLTDAASSQLIVDAPAEGQRVGARISRHAESAAQAGRSAACVSKSGRLFQRLDDVLDDLLRVAEHHDLGPVLLELLPIGEGVARGLGPGPFGDERLSDEPVEV